MRITCLTILSILVGVAHADSTAASTIEPTTTVSTDPIAAMYETYTLSVARRMSTRFALRGDVQFTPDSASSLGGPQQFALSVPIYFHAPFQGPYVEPGVFVRRQWMPGLGCLGFDCELPSSVIAGPSMAVGWQTTLASGFTIQAAIGAARTWTSAPAGIIATVPNTYLRVGYAW